MRKWLLTRGGSTAKWIEKVARHECVRLRGNGARADLATGAGYVTAERLRALKQPNPGRVALVRVSGAVTRHVLDGGRETLLTSVRSDRRARGWARVTSAEPCDFCAMLASRGGVYTATSGAFQAHDHCGCGLEPWFSHRAA